MEGVIKKLEKVAGRIIYSLNTKYYSFYNIKKRAIQVE